MKRILIALFLFLVGSSFSVAQNFDSKNLGMDVQLLMYSDPYKALKTADYIISNQSSSTKDQMYEALLVQAEIYINLRKFNLATIKIISANRLYQQVENDLLSSKYDYVLSRIYLELGFKDQFEKTFSKLNEGCKALKDTDQLLIQNNINELTAIQLIKEKKFKEALFFIQKVTSIKRKSVDPVFDLRIELLKSKVAHLPIKLNDSLRFLQFLNEIQLLQYEISKEISNADAIGVLKKMYPEYNEGVLYEDIYKDYSLQECNSNTENCFSARREYLRLIKLSLRDQQEARVNVINLIDQSEKYKILKQEKLQSNILLFLFLTTLLSIIGALVYYFFIKGKANIANVEWEKENISKEYEEKLSDQLKNFQASQLFSIPEKTEKMILAKLEIFETSKDLRDPNLSLATLAKKMNTNSKYLSEIINKHKEKNFNNYLNDLRVNYIVEKLKNHPEYLQYKTSYLAEESGFTSRTTFTTIFKKSDR